MMNLNQTLSWKITIPLGIIWLLIFGGGMLALIGTFCLLMGIIDFGRWLIKKIKK